VPAANRRASAPNFAAPNPYTHPQWASVGAAGNGSIVVLQRVEIPEPSRSASDPFEGNPLGSSAMRLSWNRFLLEKFSIEGGDGRLIRETFPRCLRTVVIES